MKSQMVMVEKFYIIFITILISNAVVLGRGIDGEVNQTNDDGEAKLGNDLPMCHYGQPDVADCIQRMAEQAREFLAKGIPSLGIQPLEPLKVPSVRLRQHNAPQNGFKYDAWFSDVMISGLTNYSVNQLDVFPEELKVSGNISLPYLEMNGDFVVLGYFQMLPVESTGKMTANFSMCTATFEALGARVHKRMVVRDSTVRLRCSGPLQADLKEAHSTTKEMEKVTDHIVGMHSTEILSDVRPAVETTLAMVLEDVANKFLKHVPYEMVFPN